MSAASKARARAGRAQPTHQPYPLGPPTGGLNTKDALANMPETDAELIDNMFCQPTWVEIRGGSSTLATMTGTPLTLLPYNGLAVSGNRLFAAVSAANNAIYRVDGLGGGAVGAAVVGGASSTIQAITNPYYDYEQFGTNAAEVLYLLNGADAPLLFDGTTWYAISTTSSPYALTGGPTPLSSLRQVAVYKQRLWFIQANTMNCYYLPQTQFAGALTLLNLAGNFKLGGSIVAVITVSIDNSAGTNDYIAFLSNQGECVMFQGYDPSNVSTWSEAAHFRIGAPVGVGRQCWQKIGMDAMIICQDGFVMLSDAMLTDRAQIVNKMSDKIRFTVSQNVQLYGGNEGWQALIYPAGNKLIVNVPTTTTTSFQYVMNTLTGAWVTWGQLATPLNATCFENFNNLLYYGKAGSVQQGDVGLSDNGAAITWRCKQAYSYLGMKNNKKQVTLVQPFFIASGNLSVAITMSYDFNPSTPTGAIPITMASGGVWGTAKWGSGWGDAQQVVNPWIGGGGDGLAVSMDIQGSSVGAAAKWQMTNYLFKPGTVFYGL